MRTNKLEKGQAAVEFGVILPAMIILILAVVVYGKPYYQKLVAQNLAYSVCSSAARTSADTANGGFWGGADLAAGSTYGVGEYTLSSGDLLGGMGLVSHNGILGPAPCEIRMTNAHNVDYVLFGSPDNYIKGVAVFFSSPFLANNSRFE